ncbi:hypothetical protein JOD03_000855 [Chryseomicrobium aureum]|nr:hypothetical protein [Chryseomicrobium aureum]
MNHAHAEAERNIKSVVESKMSRETKRLSVFSIGTFYNFFRIK